MNMPRQYPVWLQVERPVYQAFRTSIDFLTCCQVMTESGFFRKLCFRRDNSFFCHSRTGISALFLAMLSQISSTIRILSGKGNLSMFLHDVVMLEISQKKPSESTGLFCAERYGFNFRQLWSPFRRWRFYQLSAVSRKHCRRNPAGCLPAGRIDPVESRWDRNPFWKE